MEKPGALHVYKETTVKMQENTEFMNEKVRLSEVDTTLCWQKVSKPEEPSPGRKHSHSSSNQVGTWPAMGTRFPH